MSIALILFAFLLGLLPLWLMFQFWRFSSEPLRLLLFSYFLLQHIAFGFGSLLVALFDENYQYINLQGYFFYSDGLQPLAMLNLLALFAALAGAYTVHNLRWFMGKPSRSFVLGIDKSGIVGIIRKHQQSLRLIAFLSLGIHTFILVVQFYGNFRNIDASINYVIQTFVKVTPATFFFFGMLCPYDKSAGRIFLCYFLMYGILQFSTGGRGPVLFAVIIFLIGFSSVFFERFFHWRRLLLLVAPALIILPLLAIQSENIRLIRQSRVSTSLEDTVRRVQILLFANENPKEDSWGFQYTPSVSNSLFRFGARIIEVSALDVITRTPEDIPYRGWSAKDSIELGLGLIPAALRLENSVYEDDVGVMLLRKYGWAVDPAGGTSFPVTLLADSWSRFGLLGVAAIHFFWAALLTLIPFFLGRQRDKLIALIITGPFLYVVLSLYTIDLVGILSALPRLLFISVVYGILLCLFVKSTNLRK